MTGPSPGTTAARPHYQRRAAVAAMLGIAPDRLAHEMDRHPAGIPEPDAEAEGRGGKIEPLWLPRLADWQAWRATFPGRTGRPPKHPHSSEDREKMTITQSASQDTILHENEAQTWLRRNLGARPRLDLGFGGAREGRPEPHDHVLSSAGRCMWPYCHHGHPEGTVSTYQPPSFAHTLNRIDGDRCEPDVA